MYNDSFSYMGYQIWREAFDAAAIHTAILQEMKSSGYAAPSKTVDREVAKLPRFQENGRFSRSLYRQMDDNQRLSLWRQVQDDLVKDIFRTDVTGLLKPAAEADFVSKMASPQRSFEMAVFSVEDYPDTEYEAYARDNSGLFSSVHLSMLTINSGEREAQKILASIKNGEITFEDAARAHSKDGYADRGGDMGIKMVHELNWDIPEETVREKVTALARGEYSDVMKTGSGWSFFRAEEAIQNEEAFDSTMLEKVRSYVRNFERGRMEDWAIAQADSFVETVNERSFEEAISAQSIESRSFGPVPINYGNIDIYTAIGALSVSELSDSAYTDENFWKTAFSTPVNSPSQPLVQGNNVLVLFPTAEIETEQEVLDSVSSVYNSYWLNEATERSLQDYFMNSPKLEDKFTDVYVRYFMNQGNN
jgi:hypothetical protein